MVRGLILAVASVAILSCATRRSAVPAAAPRLTEVRFAGGVLRTVVPGPEWTVQGDAMVIGPGGAGVKYPLLLTNATTGSMIGVILYPSASAAPVLMADRLHDGMKETGAKVEEVEFSLREDDRASFRFQEPAAGAFARGKAVTLRLDGLLSAAIVGTWSEAAAADEASMDSVVAALRLATPP